MEIIDLSLTIDNECMTCGTPWHQIVSLERMGKIEEVGRNTSRILLGSHTGTHMDAPLHFFEKGKTIDEIDLSIVCGEVSIVNFTKYVSGDIVQIEDIRKLDVKPRMLFRFDWWKNWKKNNYYKGFPYFSSESIEYLIESGMKVMAMDTPSPDDGSAIGLTDDSSNHKLLLKNGVVIIEYLTNTDKLVENENYKLIALPLKLAGLDGSPARVIVTK